MVLTSRKQILMWLMDSTQVDDFYIENNSFPESTENLINH